MSPSRVSYAWYSLVQVLAFVEPWLDNIERRTVLKFIKHHVQACRKVQERQARSEGWEISELKSTYLNLYSNSHTGLR